jgi:hypothetical protein
MNELAVEIESLQNALIAQATGGTADDREYQRLRVLVVEDHSLRDIAPKFLRTCRNLSQFWQFIKFEYGSYAERRQYIWDAFRPLLERAESGGLTPADKSVSISLKAFNADVVHQLWSKAMERRENDPEGAVTLARTLLESVCKHILDGRGITYKNDSDLPTLYKATSQCLNIAPSQHSEDIFKRILGGCTAVVEGLGALRNRLSDAHGTGKLSVKPAVRHAELAVNLSGAVAQFLVATDEHMRDTHNKSQEI